MNSALLKGKLAVITGASTGIGKAIAETFAREGARLVLVGRSEGPLEELAATLQGTDVRVFVGDVGDPGTARRVAEQASDCDILVNNAGIFPAGLVADIEDETIDTVMRTNMYGTIYFCRAIIPLMVAKGSGAVVNISSVAARAPTPGLSLYAASKAAVEAFSRAIAAEAAPHVRVNCLSPGPTLTESVEAMAMDDKTGAVAEVTKGILLGRYGEPGEIADAALFLASDSSSFITGQTLQANGGSLMA